MLSKLWSRFFAGEACFEKIELELDAIVPESGKVKFVRKGVQSCELRNRKTQQLNLLVCTHYESEIIAVEADPRESVASVCSDFRKDYKIAEINGLTVFGEDYGLLDLCFEDLADDCLTLTLTAQPIRPKAQATKKRKVAGEIREMVMEDGLGEEEDDVTSIVEGVWKAYEEELAAPIYLKDRQIQPTEPFLVADVMVNPIDLLLRWQCQDCVAHTLFHKKTRVWALVELPDAVTNLSSGSTTEWRTLRAQRGVHADMVCLQCKGHDYYEESFGLRIRAFRIRA